MVLNGLVFKKKQYCARNFLSSTGFLRKVLDSSSFQDHSRISRVELNSPVLSQIFSEFFLKFFRAAKPDISSLVTVSEFGKSPPVPSVGLGLTYNLSLI